MKTQFSRLGIVSGATLGVAALLLAATPAAFANGGSAALGYHYYKTDFQASQTTNNQTFSKTVALREITLDLAGHLAPRFSAGFELGYSETKPHPNQPEFLNQKGYGNIVGVLAKWNPYVFSDVIGIVIRGAYRRHDVGSAIWYEAKAKGGVLFSLGPVQLQGGGYVLDYNGHLKNPGTHSHFSQKDRVGGYVSVGYQVGSGYVSLDYRGGAQEGLGVTFSGGF